MTEPILTIAKIRAAQIVAVVRASDSESAKGAIDALISGGITGIEVTFTTPGAVDVLAEIRRQYGEDIVLGMGTVTKPEQIAPAVDAGAEFLVSPGSPERLVAAMIESGLTVVAGAFTPSEIMTVVELGANIVKLFPAGLGDINYLRSLRGPFPDLDFIPTGGVDPSNIGKWLDAGAVAVGVGSEIAPGSAIRARDWKSISDRAREFLEIIGK